MRINIPIIAQTGLAMTKDQNKILDAGFDDYLSKPISEDLLISVVTKHLEATT